MALEIEGKLIKKLPQQTGEGRNGPWVKQEFVLETFGEYPRNICFETWQDRTKDLEAYQEGSLLKVTFSAESREYMDRWYTNLRAYRIEQLGATTNPPPPVTQTSAPTTTPSADTETKTADPPVEEEGDDLPF